MNRKSILALIGLIVIAFALRAVFAGAIVGWHRAPIGDEIDYHRLATSVAAGEGFQTDGRAVSRRPPLYPLCLAGLYKLTGPRIMAGRLLQVFLGTLIVWLVFLVSQRYFSRRSAWLAACLTALNPFLIFISGYLLTENVYIVLLLTLLLVLPQTTHLGRSWTTVMVAGLLLGLAALARPTAAVVALWISGFYILLNGGRVWSRVVRGAALLLVLFITILPWAARNHAEFGKWILFTSHGGMTFYQGNNARVLEIPQYHGGVAPLHMLPEYRTLRVMSAVDKDEAAWALGKQFLREHKRQVPVLLWRKFARFWRFRSDVGISGVKSGWWWSKDSRLGRLATNVDVGFVYAVVAIPLFVVVLVATYRSYRRLWILYGIVVAHTLITLVFRGSLRMRIPIEPVIAIMAAEGLHRFIGWLRRDPPSAISDTPRSPGV